MVFQSKREDTGPSDRPNLFEPLGMAGCLPNDISGRGLKRIKNDHRKIEIKNEQKSVAIDHFDEYHVSLSGDQ